MSYRKFKFLLNKTVSCGYSTTEEPRTVNYGDFMHCMKTRALHTPSTMSGWIRCSYPGGLLKRHQFVLVLDCDSFNAASLARVYLAGKNIAHFDIESSLGRFWIVADYSGSHSEVTRFMECIPGVDWDYLTCCKRGKNYMCLRAYPKINGFTPDVGKYYAQIGNFNPDGVPAKFISALYQYWMNNPDVIEVTQNLIVENATYNAPKDVDDSFVSEHASSYGGCPVNPDFMADMLKLKKELEAEEKKQQQIESVVDFIINKDE